MAAERLIRVKLLVEAPGAQQAGEQAAGALDKTAVAADKGQQKLSQWASVAKTAVVAGAAVAAGAVVKLGMDYEKSLNTLQAVSGATAGQMAEVSKVAKQLGNDVLIPGASASDAAAAMTELAKGGLSVKEAMTAARGTLQLATAAQVDGATAAQIQANAMNAFSIKADQAGHVADVLANVSNAASGEITDFAYGLQASAGVAASFGISLDDTAVALGLFAKNGMIGSDAGTSLKTALIALANPTEKQAGALEDLGVTVYDAQGKFMGLRSVTDALSTASKNMTTEQFNAATATAFGSDAMRAAGFLAKEGATGFDAMAAAVGRSGGAAEVAAAQAQGMNGAWNNFKNTAENAALSLYETVAPALTAITDAGAGLLGFLGEVPAPVYAAAAALVAIKVLDGPLGAMFTHVKDGFKKATEGAVGFAAKAKGIGGAMVGALGGPVGLAITGLTFGISALGGKIAGTEVATHDFAAAIDELTGAIDRSKIKDVVTDDTLSKMHAAGVAAGDYTEALSGNADAQHRVREALAANIAAHSDDYEATARAQALYKQFATDITSGLGAQDSWTAKQKEAAVATDAAWRSLTAEATAAGLAQLALEGAAPAADTYATVLKTASNPAVQRLAGLLDIQASAAYGAADGVDYLTLAMQLMAGKNVDAETAARANAAAMRGIGADARALADANKGVADAQKAVNDATKKFGAKSPEAAAAQRDLASAQDRVKDSLDAQAEGFDKAAASAFQQTDSVYRNAQAQGDGANAVILATAEMQKQRDQFIKSAEAAGIGTVEAGKLADAQGLIPGNVSTAYAEKGLLEAKEAVSDLQKQIDAIPDKVTKELTVKAVASIQMTPITPMYFNSSTGKLEPARENGGVVYAANGLLVGGRGKSMVANGAGAGLTWAEEATGKEWYISKKPGQESRNRGFLSDAAAEFGGRVDWGGYQPAFLQGGGANADAAGLRAEMGMIGDAIRAVGGVRQLATNLTINNNSSDAAGQINSLLARIPSAL